MLAYAANAPRPLERRPSPNALLAIVAVHVGLLAAVMSAKMDLPQRILNPPIKVELVPTPESPPTTERVKSAQPRQPTLSIPETQLPLPPIDPPIADDPTPRQPIIDPGPGPSVDPPPRVDPTPMPIGTDARLLTPAAELKPPYPQSKLLAEEEATLKLRLTIDERGRVIAVDPVGRTDTVFLEAARRYLIAHWRYRPASEGGRAIASSTVITLRFQLDG